MTEGKIVNIQPLQPVKVVLELTENEKTSNAEAIMFIDQVSGVVYDSQGPVEESVQEAIEKWIEKRSEEVERKIRTGMVQANPEQLAAMGIDLKNDDPVNTGKIIMSR